MTEFLLAIAAFLIAHLVPAVPSVRSRLVASLGRGLYLLLYSGVSLALLAWVIVAAVRADTIMLWAPAAWQWWVPILAMPFAGFLLVAGLSESNPLSISVRSGSDPGPVTAITRHPVLWGFLIWALAHIPPNGRLVPVILFGVMGALAAAGFPLLDRKARKRLGEARWSELAAEAPLVPFGQARTGWTHKDLRRLLLAAIATLVLYAWFLLQGHAFLIGPDPLASLKALAG